MVEARNHSFEHLTIEKKLDQFIQYAKTSMKAVAGHASCERSFASCVAQDAHFACRKPRKQDCSFEQVLQVRYGARCIFAP